VVLAVVVAAIVVAAATAMYPEKVPYTRKTLRTQERSSDRIGRSGETRRGYILLSSAAGGRGVRRIYNIGTSGARSFAYRPERRRLSKTLIRRRAAAASGRRSAICASRRGNHAILGDGKAGGRETYKK